MKFEYQKPTRIIFGAGTLSRLGEVGREHGTKALLVNGVEPNPQLSSVKRGGEMTKKRNAT